MSKLPAKPTLAENLAEAAAIKVAMSKLLTELEQAATGLPADKLPTIPGAWRHRPQAWAQEYFPERAAKQ